MATNKYWNAAFWDVEFWDVEYWGIESPTPQHWDDGYWHPNFWAVGYWSTSPTDTLNQASETDEAFAFSVKKSPIVRQASETDSAQTMIAHPGYIWVELSAPSTSAGSLLEGYTGSAPVTGDTLFVQWQTDPDGFAPTLNQDGTFEFSSKPLRDQTLNRFVVQIDGTTGTEATYTIEITVRASADQAIETDLAQTFTVTQSYALTATSIESASELTSPAIGQLRTLLADDIESASEVSTATLTVQHALTATSIESASELTAPDYNQATYLLADDVESTSELSTPTLLEKKTYLADDLESASELTVPALAQKHALLADDIESASEVTTPTLNREADTGRLLVSNVVVNLVRDIVSNGVR